ncbi:hypothetical protein N657DRAFT_675301 [Parathielavia appendiculata]|uniref:Uncharacterized protein n=1 Tax=Parathielavia appendiculata TaxID=2587402 RepID=A0AAN6TRI8_9PEZI|nr:hypothetical protein N657DRAFT_675301 [Parathielavia appendiculata]
MEQDQFGGRTDDDLFSDDIEPVDETATLSAPAPVSTSHVPAQPEPAPAPAAQPPAAAPKPARSSLAQSRHNPNIQLSKSSRQAANNNNGSHRSKPAKSETSDTPSAADPSSPPTTNPKPLPTGPREPSSTPHTTNNNNNTPATATTNTNNTASAVSAARLNSGANPRQKLTDVELAARMEKMRLLAAEKTRRFEEAQRDEAQHAVAYAKGMEEARKRRAEEAARRKIAEEERRKLEEERARNRERKLKALEGREREGRPSGPAPALPPPKTADLKAEDFPALPSSTAAPKKIDTAWVAKPGAAEIPISPPVGKWDEEVAASLAANQT